MGKRGVRVKSGKVNNSNKYLKCNDWIVWSIEQHEAAIHSLEDLWERHNGNLEMHSSS